MTKYSVILGNLGNTCDRFLSSGYKDQPPKAEMIRQAAAIPGVKGVELVGTWDVTSENVDEVGCLLAKHALECVSIIPDHFSQKRWGRGAFTAKDPAIREQALEETMIAAELALDHRGGREGGPGVPGHPIFPRVQAQGAADPLHLGEGG